MFRHVDITRHHMNTYEEISRQKYSLAKLFLLNYLKAQWQLYVSPTVAFKNSFILPAQSTYVLFQCYIIN
jgi:hypothetical protein